MPKVEDLKTDDPKKELTLETATIEELKAAAYDILVQLEQLNKNLAIINAEIQRR